MIRSVVLSIGTAFAALLLAVSPTAGAEETGSADGAIEEILVTAQKRAQSIQDVHISMNAFTQEDLDDLGWTDITQVANQSPNLDIKYVWGNSMPVYTIRGVGMQSFQAQRHAQCRPLHRRGVPDLDGGHGRSPVRHRARRGDQGAPGRRFRAQHQRRRGELFHAQAQPRGRRLCTRQLRPLGPLRSAGRGRRTDRREPFRARQRDVHAAERRLGVQPHDRQQRRRGGHSLGAGATAVGTRR